MDDNLKRAVAIFSTEKAKAPPNQLNRAKIEAKDHIVRTMVSQKIPFIKTNDDKYITIRRKQKPRKIDSELIQRAFLEFGSNPRLHGGNDANKEDQAKHFAEYTMKLSKHCGDWTYDLKCTKKKPMQAVVLDSFNNSAATG